MRRYMKLEELSRDEKEVRFRIAEQTHREMGFAANDEYTFRANNGVRLSSVGYPEMYESMGSSIELCVRGADETEDFRVLSCSLPAFERLLYAVTEYNVIGLAEENPLIAGPPAVYPVFFAVSKGGDYAGRCYISAESEEEANNLLAEHKNSKGPSGYPDKVTGITKGIKGDTKGVLIDHIHLKKR